MAEKKGDYDVKNNIMPIEAKLHLGDCIQITKCFAMHWVNRNTDCIITQLGARD